MCQAPNPTANYNFNAQFTLACATGFEAVRVIDDAPLTCKGDNEWIGGRITCKPKSCPIHPYPNADIITEEVRNTAMAAARS